MPIGITINPSVFARGVGGEFVTTLAGRMESYTHTIGAAFGFESCTMTFRAKAEECATWLDRLLYPVIVYGPEGTTIWEGFISSVEVALGQERRALSLDGMANRVLTRYTTVRGVPAYTAQVSDTTSQALYGIKDYVESLSVTDTTAAENLAAASLALRKYPVSRPTSEVGTGDLGETSVTLTCAGWYDTLGWVLLERTDTTTEATTTQVGTLISGSTPGIGAVNSGYVSTETTYIEASGISCPRTIAADTSYREAIEARLGQGNSSDERLAWGVYEDRRFHVTEWAGASPDTVTYRREIGTGLILSDGYNEVYPWDVRPDAIYEVPALLDIGAVTSADSIARYYVERVTFAADSGGVRVSLEPAASSSLDARLAALNATVR